MWSFWRLWMTRTTRFAKSCLLDELLSPAVAQGGIPVAQTEVWYLWVMDDVFFQLLKAETLYLSVLVVIVTFFIRRSVELAYPKAKDPKSPFGRWWSGVLLYLLPVIAGGGIAALVKAYSSQLADIESPGGAAVWGITVGWFASFLYKVLRKTIKKRTGIDLTPDPVDPTKPLSDPPKA